MSHTPHPNVRENGLADGCPRCAEHAEHPLRDLDSGVLHDLVDRTLRNRFGGGPAEASSPYGPHVAPRSEAEAEAMARVMTALEQAGKIAAVAPNLLSGYLRDRWRLDGWPV